MQPEIGFLRDHASFGSMKQQLVAKFGVGRISRRDGAPLWLRGLRFEVRKSFCAKKTRTQVLVVDPLVVVIERSVIAPIPRYMYT